MTDNTYPEVVGIKNDKILHFLEYVPISLQKNTNNTSTQGVAE